MSALPPKADIRSALTYVRFGPIADIGPSSLNHLLCACRSTDKFAALVFGSGDVMIAVFEFALDETGQVHRAKHSNLHVLRQASKSKKKFMNVCCDISE